MSDIRKYFLIENLVRFGFKETYGDCTETTIITLITDLESKLHMLDF